MRELLISKSPLAVRTAQRLEEAIQQELLAKVLPPERALAEQIGVSRPVLREALVILEQQGVISLKGKRRQVIGPSRSTVSSHDRIGKVRLLCRRSSQTVNHEISQIHESLAPWLIGQGIDYTMEISSASYDTDPKYSLQKVLTRNPSTLWLLYRSTPAMQRWMQDNHVPSVVLGGLYDSIRLPSLDLDFRSAARHAAGMIRGRGHRSVAIIRQERMLPGDQASLQGFAEGWPEEQTRPTILHDGSPESLLRTATSLARRKNTPRVWFVFGGQHVFTLLGWLATAKLRLGVDIHIVSRNSDPYFDLFQGGIAHYRRNMKQFDSRLKRLIEANLGGFSSLAPQQGQVECDFVDGSSLGRISGAVQQ